MALLVSAKGNDLLAWRACGDFAATFRQSLLARLEFCRSDQGEALLLETSQALAGLIAANDAFSRHSRDLIGEVSAGAEPTRLRELVTSFYAGLYDHIAMYRSATAFYELSSQLLQALSNAIIRYAHTTLDRPLPQVKLVALGTAGRQEFSPFNPLQLMLVHAEANATEQEALSRFGELIHEGFQACGFQVDGIITTRNPDWCGSMSQWRQRLEQRLKQGGVSELVNLFRLSDQNPLYCDDGFEPEFKLLCRSCLKEHRSAMIYQATRVRNLSHGIGILGGMRFEKKGLYRGLFALRANALQPLAAAISIIGLIKNLESISIPQRIREILWKRELNVDMAERLLQAWHVLHELRLTREGAVHPDWASEATFYLNVEEMPGSEQILLRESLDAVAAIQRQVGVIISGMEE